MTHRNASGGNARGLPCRRLTTALCALALTLTLAVSTTARTLVISGDSDDETVGEVITPVEEAESPELSGDVLDLTGNGGDLHGGFIGMGVTICFARNRHDELFQGIARSRHVAMAEALNKCHQISRHCVAAACTRL